MNNFVGCTVVRIEGQNYARRNCAPERNDFHDNEG